MSCARRLPLLAVALSVASPAAAQIPPPYAGQGIVERPCPNDLFAVEAPLWAPPFPSTFARDLQNRIKSVLSASWFCPPGVTCNRFDFTPRVQAILPNYQDPALYPSIPKARRDGHRRFLQLDFLRRHKDGSWRRTAVLPEQGCSVVHRIRLEASALLGVKLSSCWGTCPQPPVLVSRECLTQPLDVEAWLDPSVASWALDRIGAQAASNLPPVDVALIDTGVPAMYRSALGVVSEEPLPAFYRPDPPDHHAHGAQMAALIRSVAPNAVIRSHRALDDGGSASVGTLARAIDDALFPNPSSTAPRGPVILNLSLGFPPHVSQPATLYGSSCSTWEDGLGESVRYTLEVARVLASNGPPVIAVAAGGNQILEHLSLPESWARGPVKTPCGTLASAPQIPWAFFPAGLAAEASCGSGATARAVPLLAAGASDFLDRAALTTIFSAEPILAAPGQHVFVSSPLPPVSTGPVCDPSGLGLARGFESPVALSGSSVSAALTSGALARLIGLRPERKPGAAWDAASLARFLYLTAEPVCRVRSKVVRRLSVTRTEAAVGAGTGACENLFDCIASSGHPAHPIVTPGAASACRTELDACLGPDVMVSSSCSTHPAGLPWPSGYAASLPGHTCYDEWYRPPGPSSTPPISGPGAYADVQLAGLGPQPTVGSCPTCQLEVYPSYRIFVLVAELNDEYPSGTWIGDPYLVVFDREKRPMRWLPLDGAPSSWTPGRVVKVVFEAPSDPADPIRVLLDGGMAALDLQVVIDGRSSRVASPLEVMWYP